MTNESEGNGEVARIDHTATIRRFIDLIGSGRMDSPDIPNPLTTDSIERDGRYSSHVAMLPSPINLVGEVDAHWSVFLLFPGTEEIDAIDGTPEILEYCNGVDFYNFTEDGIWMRMFGLDLEDQTWRINSSKTENISTSEIHKVLTGVGDLIK